MALVALLTTVRVPPAFSNSAAPNREAKCKRVVVAWTCPDHPQVRVRRAGRCPISPGEKHLPLLRRIREEDLENCAAAVAASVDILTGE